MTSSSILVLRSACLFQEDLKKSNSSGGINDDNHDANADVGTTSVTGTLQEILHSLPITCDITVLPEIPLESHVSAKENRRHQDGGTNQEHHDDDIRMERQALHPCGMDNVLLLRDLPPAADPTSYLLSLSSCQVQVSQGDMESADMKLGAMMDPAILPIQAVPSTFSFRLQTAPSSPSQPVSKGNNGVLVNPASAAVELQVVFDYSLALDLLEHTVSAAVGNNRVALQEAESLVPFTRERENVEQVNDSPVTTSSAPPLVQSEHAQTKCHSTQHPQEHVVHHDSQQQQHEQLLHVIRELAEKEAHHLDCMLVGLGFVFVLLMVHYTRTVMPVVRAKKKRRQGMQMARDAKGTRGKNNSRPPVSSVTFRRSNDTVEKNTTLPVLLEKVQQQQTTFSTENGVAVSPSSAKTPFVASESTIGMAETSSLSSASFREQQFSFLPTEYSPPKKTVVDKENVNPNDEQQLSPCSKLAQRWNQTKEQRRQSRKGGGSTYEQHRVILPVAEVGQSPPVLQERGQVPPQQVQLPNLLTSRRNEPVIDKTTPLPLDPHRKVAVTPETRLVSQESFLQDYWGE